MTSALAPRIQRAAVGMLAAWMSERYFRTFRVPAEADSGASDPGAFDAELAQRDRRVGVTVGALWDGSSPPGAEDLESLVGADLEADGEPGAYALWVPPGAPLPVDEPARSQFRLLVSRGVRGLAPGERRELRVPVTLRLAKIDGNGEYVSVVGGMSSEWTRISEGVPGAFHLDSREIHRLPEERAEVDILVSRVRDRAGLLETGELTTIDVHDYWLVSRLPAEEPRGLTVVGAPPEVDALDGALVRRMLRAHIARTLEQRAAGAADMSALVLVGALGHIGDERATAALRGMNPATYSGLDLIALVADGQVRQVLQPRSLPWEPAPAPSR